jgi:hypothetical protein
VSITYTSPQLTQRIIDQLTCKLNELRCITPTPLFNPPPISIIDWNLFQNMLVRVVNYISTISECDHTSILLATLGSISSALCGRYVVELNEEWIEPCCLYIALSAPSGSRKSLVIRTLKEPFEKHFAQLADEFNNQSCDHKNNEKERAMLKREITKHMVKKHVNSAMKDGVYIGDPNEILMNLSQVIDRIDEKINSPKPKYRTSPNIFLSIASRVTAGADMAQQGEFGCVFEAEGSFFEEEIARKTTHPGLYLKAYDMERYDYSSQKLGKITMHKPAMNITAFVQPDVLRRFYSNRNLKSRGLNARFLPFFASKVRSLTPQITTHFTTNSTPKFFPTISRVQTDSEAMINYNTNILSMLRKNYTQDINRTIIRIHVTDEAYEYIKEYERIQKQNIDMFRNLPIESFLSKAHGTAVRLALSISAWNNNYSNTFEITINEIKAAISLLDSITRHAFIAFNAENIQVIEDAQNIINWITRCDWAYSLPFFEANAAQNAIGVLHTQRYRAALDLLENYGYVRLYDNPQTDRVYVVHPLLTAHTAPSIISSFKTV